MLRIFLTFASLACMELAAAQGLRISPSAVPPSRVNESAMLSDHVYRLDIPSTGLVTGSVAGTLPSPPGYSVVGALNNPSSGFQGAAYQHLQSGHVTVVYRGTDELRDAQADLGVATQRGSAGRDFARGLGATGELAVAVGSRGLEAQLQDARSLTDHTIRTYGEQRTALAGHSLGGGIAQVESARTGLVSNTYDSAGMRDYIATNYPNADVTKITNHNRGDDKMRDLTTQPGYIKVYPSVDDGVQIRGRDGQLVPGGRITATPLEAASILRPDLSSAGANHKISDFQNSLRAGAVAMDPPTFQPLKGDASPVVPESELRAKFEAMATQNRIAATNRAALNPNPEVYPAPTDGGPMPIAPLTLPSPLGVSAPPRAPAPPAAPRQAALPSPASPPPPPASQPLPPALPPIPSASAKPVPTAPASLPKPAASDGHASVGKACTKVYKTKDGCHPGHVESAHKGGCHC